MPRLHANAAAHLAVLLAFPVAAACSDDPTSGVPDASVTPEALADVTTNRIPGDEAAIEALVAALDDAWAAKDAAAYAAPFSVDADIVNPLGGIQVGRSAIETQHVLLFNGLFAGSTQTLRVRRMTFLTGTLAVVDLNATLTGFAGTPPGLPQAQPGAVLTRVRWVLQKRAGQWQILSQQMTALVPGQTF